MSPKRYLIADLAKFVEEYSFSFLYFHPPFSIVKIRKLIYKIQETNGDVSEIIRSIWMVEDLEASQTWEEKIIPDGYPELIFHYGDPYECNINGSWQLQGFNLIAGQIRNHFKLRNTGRIGMLGVKMQPWAVKELFDFDMKKLTNHVLNIDILGDYGLESIAYIASGSESFDTKLNSIISFFEALHQNRKKSNPKGIAACKMSLEMKGGITVQELCAANDIGERTLERFFKTYIGLSPKFYTRILRFSQIFEHVKRENFEWSQISHLSGFYDQSHFIKNFKEFTGEEPSNYGFDNETFANFFLRR